MKLARDEMETVVHGNAQSEEWKVSTSDPRVLRRMQKAGWEPRHRGDSFVQFVVPYDRLKILGPKKEMSR